MPYSKYLTLLYRLLIKYSNLRQKVIAIFVQYLK